MGGEKEEKEEEERRGGEEEPDLGGVGKTSCSDVELVPVCGQ